MEREQVVRVGTILALAAVWTATLAGCTRKTYNEYYTAEYGAIQGTLVPLDTSARISVEGSRTSTRPDRSGKFLLGELVTGIYTVEVVSSVYSTRRIHSVSVLAATVTEIGEIVLSTNPYPIYQVYPGDGAEDVPRGNYLTVSSDEPIDPAALDAAASISPHVEIAFAGPYEDWHYGTYIYRSEVQQLSLGTEYEFRLDGSLLTEWGTTLGEDVVSRFTTEPLRADVRMPAASILGETRLRDFYVEVRFNDAVHYDSFLAATEFAPPLPGDWILDERASPLVTLFTFLPADDGPSADTEYQLTIRDGVILNGSAGLTYPRIVLFHTEPYRVTGVFPGNGSLIPQGSSLYVRLSFNSFLDTASTAEYFSLEAIGHGPITGTIGWDVPRLTFRFIPSELLPGGRTYRITVSKGLRFSSGATLGEDFTSIFRIA